MEVDSGVLQKMYAEEAFHPKTAAGKRIVTAHGDFKADNTLIDDKGVLVPIDFEATCVAPAVVDLGFGGSTLFLSSLSPSSSSLSPPPPSLSLYNNSTPNTALCTHLNSGWGVKYETRFEFFQTYLKLSGQPSTDDDTKALMLDAEINTLIGCVGLLSNVWSAQVPLLRGKPHPTSGGTCDESEGPTG